MIYSCVFVLIAYYTQSLRIEKSAFKDRKARCRQNKGDSMGLLEWAIIAFVIAVIAGALGFTGVARGAASVAKILFGIFLVVAVILIILFALGINILT
jgi:uncharacterized membrane protein YtjA (UPF0391 family)